jgi:D-arabinose 1-dehydrogenase-like Zn-dependent alcohol dehydrogenase
MSAMTMIAARVHKYGEPMQLDRIPIPEPRSTDVLVEVKACGIVPNLARVVANFFGTQAPDPKAMPPLPAIFGLDPVGVITKVGDQVRSMRPGDRVYVNPARKCGSCRMCRSGQPLDCPNFTFQGYFGRSQEIMKAYPYGGLCQFITAPEDALVKLPDNVSNEAAARFGYLGTAYAAMKKLGVGPGQTFLVNGISGMLGLNAAMLALAMGATRSLGTGRNKVLLDRVKALSPQRIEIYAVDESVPVGPADPLVALDIFARDRCKLRTHQLNHLRGLSVIPMHDQGGALARMATSAIRPLTGDKRILRRPMIED